MKATTLSQSMRTTTMLLVAVLAALAFAATQTLAVTPPSSSINNILPRYGSLKGGTLVTISGRGFEREGQDGTTTVYIGTTICETIEYYSSDTQIVCRTKEHPLATVLVNVQVVSIDNVHYSECQTNCYYRFHSDQTPYVERQSRSAVAGYPMYLYGLLRGEYYGHYDVRIGSTACEIDQDPDDIFLERTWHRGRLDCTLPEETTAGRTNPILSVQSGETVSFGYQNTPNSLIDVPINGGDKYSLTVHPLVTGLSQSAIGTQGGQDLVITGKGFSETCQDNTVLVAGVACPISDCSPTEITCRIQPFSSSAEETHTPAGLNLRSWDTVPGWPFDPQALGQPDVEVMHVDGANGFHDVFQRHSTESIGYFVPPLNGNYTFYVSVDDQGSLELSADSHPDNLTELVRINGYSSNFYIRSGQISDPLALQAGQKYFYRFRHRDTGGNSWLNVAMKVDSDEHVSTPDQQYLNSIKAVQRIFLTTIVTREEHTISFVGAHGGSFLLYGEDGISRSIDWDNSAGRFANAIKDVSPCNSISAWTWDETDPNTQVVTRFYKARYNCPTDVQRPIPSVIESSEHKLNKTNNYNVAYERTTEPSIPLRGQFRIGYNGTWSELLPWDASSSAIASQLIDLTPVEEVQIDNSGNWHDYRTMTLFFHAPAGAHPLLEVDTSLMTGSNVTGDAVEVDEGNENSLFLDPIPAEYFQRYYEDSTSAVIVKTNGIPSACDGAGLTNSSCAFAYDDSLTPVIDHVSAPAEIDESSTISITGSGFNASASVYLQASADGSLTACHVTSQSHNSISCNNITAQAGMHTVVVIIEEFGQARDESSGETEVLAAARVDTVSPTTAGVAGGAVIAISGYGFASGDNVTVGGVLCPEISASSLLYKCIVPELPSTASMFYNASNTDTTSVAIAINGDDSDGLMFTYDWQLTYAVESISVDQVPSAITTDITFTGVFPQATDLVHSANNSDCVQSGNVAAVVFDGERACSSVSVSDDGSTVTCSLVRGDALAYSAQENQLPRLSFCTAADGSTTAHTNPDVVIDIAHRVSATTPAQSGLGGGAVITLTGAHFGSNINAVGVRVHNASDPTSSIPCTVTAVSQTSVECSLSKAAEPMVDAYIEMQINGFVAKCDASACAIALYDTLTPIITSVSGNTGSQGSVLVVEGSNFLISPVVTIGGEECVVSFFNDTFISCEAPALIAGSYPILVSCGSNGDAIHATGSSNEPVFQFHYQLTLGQLSATTGSTAGGLEVTLSGDGFNSEDASANAVVFAGSSVHAVVLSATHSSLNLIVPTLLDQSPGTPVSAGVQVTVMNGVHYSAAHSVRDASDCANETLCTFTYDAAVSGSVSSVSPSSGSSGTNITVSGSQLLSALRVSIGGVDCPIINNSSRTDTMLECAVGDVPAGPHQVLVHLPTGIAPGRKVFTSALEISSVAPAASSFAGGTLVTLRGRGFGQWGADADALLRDGGAAVHVCGSPCSIVSSSYEETICRTPEVHTVESHEAFNHISASILEGTSSDDRLFDEDFESGTSACEVTFDLGESMVASLHRIRVFPTLRLLDRAVGASFHVSADGVNFTEVARVDSSITYGWTAINLDPTEYVRYIVMRGADSGRCSMTELEYIGISAVSVEESKCPVAVGVFPVLDTSYGVPAESSAAITDLPATSSVNPNVTVQYTIADTPFVTSVSPRFGSSLGGTLVTITGERLPSVAQGASVTVNGYECTVETASSGSEIQCTTTARSKLHQPTLVVESDAGSRAVSQPSARFRYLDRWSQRNTWLNDEPPVAGDTVVIPEGQVVLLDESPPKLFLLLINGELVFDRQDGLDLHATYIWVHGGYLEIGTEEEPFLNTATITLYGDRFTSIGIPTIGVKVLAVTHFGGLSGHGGAHDAHVHHEDMGRLEIHGKPRKRTWVKVASTVAAGSNRIDVSDPVDFEAGELIVLTHQSHRSRIEELVVAGLENGGSTIVLESATVYEHESAVHTIGGEVVDMRVEVGIISRNIVIQGEPGKSERQAFGSHIIAAHGAPLHLENVELRRCGQAGVLGRYCSHLHEGGALRSSYINSNSIHHSFQRACTVHATDHASVKHNVAYDVKGHTYFVEDGNEMFNVFEENLGILTHKLFVMLKSDTKPATFWTSSPTNLWRNNVATGCVNDGYWFELPGHPGGPSFTTSICPVHSHVHEFRNNTAHANGVHGLRIYPAYHPRVDPCDSDSGPSPEYFHNFTSFYNGANGIFGKDNGDLHHVNAKLVGNGAEELHWKKFTQIVYRENLPNIIDCLFVNDIDGKARVTGQPGLMMPQHEFFHVSGGTFVNYLDGGAISGCASCNSDTEFKQGGYTFRLEGLEFINTSKYTLWTPPFKQIFHDLDGSLTGFVNGTATPFYAYNVYPGTCDAQGDMYDNGIVCDGSVRVRRLQIDDVDPDELDFQMVQLGQREHPGRNDTVGFRVKESYGWVVIVVNDHTYDAGFVSLIDFRTMRLRYSEAEYLQYGDEFLYLVWNYTNYRYAFDVTYANGDVRAPVSLINNLNLTDPFGTGKTVPNSKEWHVILTTNGIDTSVPWSTYSGGPYVVDVTAVQCAPGACNDLFSDEPLYDPTLWSDVTLWCRDASTRTATYARNGGEYPPCDFTHSLPLEGDNVVINSRMYAVLDVNPARLGHLQIVGKVEFDDSEDRLLEADTIELWGELQVGSRGRPFEHEAVIRLHGNAASNTLIVNNERFLGNKVIGVLGNLELHGQVPTVSWTRLETTAAAGASELVLVEAVDWVAGDTVVVSGTEYDGDQYESATVASVSEDGLTLTLAAPLAHRHFAGVASSGRGDVELRAVVAKLNRNVRFEGAKGSSAEGGDVHGAHVVVMDVEFDEGIRIGSSSITGVEMRHCGQEALEHACVAYIYDQSYDDDEHPFNLFDSSTMSDANNYGIVSEGSYGVTISNSVIHNTQRDGIELDANTQRTSILRTAVIGNRRTPDAPTDWIQPFAGIFADTSSVRLEGNVVCGAADAGYTLRVNTCGTADDSNSLIRNNEVHSALIGVFILPESRTCLELQGFKAWKIAHIAVLSVDQRASVELSGLEIADSHIGISVNFFNPSLHVYLEISDSIVLGTTDASTCSASMLCRAAVSSDVAAESTTRCNSVMGNGFRRVGLLLPQITNRGKTCGQDFLSVCRPVNLPERLCSMPWEKEYGLPGTQHGTLRVRDTAFSNFYSDDCGKRSVGITVNPTQRNYSPEQYYEGVSWSGSDTAARFWFDRIAGLTSADCNDGCDALLGIVAHDEDGSFGLGSAGDVVLSASNPGAADSLTRCSDLGENGAIVCGDMSMATATFENIDRDRGGRLIGPIKLERLSEGVPERSHFSLGPYDDGCAKRFFFGQYPFPVEAGRVYNLNTSVTLPSNSRIRFHSTDPNEKVLLRVYVFLNNQALRVVNGGREVAPLERIPTLSDGRGANTLDARNNQFYLVLQGSSDASKQIYDIRTINRIQLNLTFSLTAAEFEASREALVSNLAILLNIPAYRIKIVEVHAVNVRETTNSAPEVSDPSVTLGLNNQPSRRRSAWRVRRAAADGINVEIEIADANNGTVTTSDEDADMELDELNEIVGEIASAASQGTLKTVLAASGLPLENLVIAPPAGNGADASSQVSLSLGSNGSDGLSMGAIIGAAVGAVIVAVLIAGFVYKKREDKRTVLAGESEKNDTAARKSSFQPGVAQYVATKDVAVLDLSHEEREDTGDGDSLEKVAEPVHDSSMDGLIDVYPPPEKAASRNGSSIFRKLSTLGRRKKSSVDLSKATGPETEADFKHDRKVDDSSALEDVSVANRVREFQAKRCKIVARKTWEYVKVHEWYHPQLGATAAAKVIEGTPAGTFVVYGRKCCYLCVSSSAGVLHLPIENSPDKSSGDDEYLQFRLNTTAAFMYKMAGAKPVAQPMLEDLESLVKYYHEHSEEETGLPFRLLSPGDNMANIKGLLGRRGTVTVDDIEQPPPPQLQQQGQPQAEESDLNSADLGRLSRRLSKRMKADMANADKTLAKELKAIQDTEGTAADGNDDDAFVTAEATERLGRFTSLRTKEALDNFKPLLLNDLDDSDDDGDTNDGQGSAENGDNHLIVEDML